MNSRQSRPSRLLALASLLAFILSASSCATSQKSRVQKLERPLVSTLTQDLQTFWSLAKSRPFEQQLDLWNATVESKHQTLYAVSVNHQKTDSDWQQKKRNRLEKRFKLFSQNWLAVEREFVNFEKEFETQLARFKTLFPNAKFAFPVVLMPGANFNGKVGSVDEQGGYALLFSPDAAIELQNDRDILYAHELFHAYHLSELNVTPESFGKDSRFSLILWLEGLASFVSHRLNPTKTLSQVLMQDDLAQLDTSVVSQLSKSYLEIVDGKIGAATDESKITFRKWFNSHREKLSSQLPYRVGYRLGYEVCVKLNQESRLEEMVLWREEEIHSRVISALRDLSKPAKR